VSEVVLYGRAGCHLCDEAREVLERLREELPFALIERDIDAREEWQRAYFERIPVVVLDGHELFDYFVDERRLRRLLRVQDAPGDDLQSER
jgi:glutaredoxin